MDIDNFDLDHLLRIWGDEERKSGTSALEDVKAYKESLKRIDFNVNEGKTEKVFTDVKNKLFN